MTALGGLNVRVSVAVALAASVGGLAAFRVGLNPSSGDALALREGRNWVTWWRQDQASHEWRNRATLAERAMWKRGVPGLEWSELQLRGANEAWRTRLVVVRVDPRQIELSLIPAFTRAQTWSVDDVDSDVALALDAGQFRQTLPWGWVMTRGAEILKPEYAPLAGAVMVDASGAVRIAAPDEVDGVRRRGGLREAFQSYPMLLQDGVVPRPLRQPGGGVNLQHRDARLALGTLADGKVIVAITRFDVLGPSFGRVPLGLTTPEMAAVMGALGCRRALLLDGGISSQLSLRDHDGMVHRWPGTRRVPLGLVGRPRVKESLGSAR